jgi:hypothetical protein
MRILATSALAFLLAAGAACGSPSGSSMLVPGTGSRPATPSSTLTFTPAQSGSTQTAQTVSGGTGRISLTGSVPTPSPCWTVTAAHAVDALAITVTITATAAANAGACEQVVTYNNYQAAITGLTAATYTLTVVHDRGGSAATAFTGTATVG